MRLAISTDWFRATECESLDSFMSTCRYFEQCSLVAFPLSMTESFSRVRCDKQIEPIPLLGR